MKWIAGIDVVRFAVGWFLFLILTAYQLAADVIGLPGATSSVESTVPQWLLPAELIIAIGWSVLLLAVLRGRVLTRGQNRQRRRPRM